MELLAGTISLMGKGKYHLLDTSSVKSKSSKTTTFMAFILGKHKSSMYDRVVIFLGEAHNSVLDVAVTTALLAAPPVVSVGNTWVYFERTLDNVYVYGVAFASHRTEPVNLGKSRRARSTDMADRIQDLFDNHGALMIYVVCGDEHGKEIFDSLDSRMNNAFSYFHKPSAVS